MNKRYKWAIVFLIVFLTVVIFLKATEEDSWICTKYGWTKHGNPAISKPSIPCSISEEHFLVEKYISNNISALSPEKEVLGGNFYVTKISWIDNNFGKVEYEDGHVAFKAVFDYTVKNNGNDFSIEITNFKII